MDKQLQIGYEHSVPKVKGVGMECSYRSALIFRQGQEAAVLEDSSIAVSRSSMIAPVSKKRIYGAIHDPCKILKDGLREGGLYSMQELVCSRAHLADRATICGSIKEGAASIVVRQNDKEKREAFDLEWARVTSTRRQFGGALATSCHKKNPIRVFVNSDCKEQHAPNKRKGTKMNLYCGLYVVENMWNGEGHVTEAVPAERFEQYTYFLQRLPKGAGNLITTQQLFDKILDGKGMRHRRFRSTQSKDCTGIAIPDDSTSRKSKSKSKKK